MASRSIQAIDLTLEDSSNSESDFQIQFSTIKYKKKEIIYIDISSPSLSDQEDSTSEKLQDRAKIKKDKSIPKAPLTMSSMEIRTMSSKRCEKTRIPDIILFHQLQGDYWPSHKSLYKAYIQQNDNSIAPWKFINQVDQEPHPPSHYAFVNHYIHDEKLISHSNHQVNEFVTIPAGCDCKDGNCRPDTCLCRQMHSDLAPAPWKELKVGFAYNSQGLLRDEVLSYPQSAIWECNKNCTCRGICKNRIVGRGRQVKLQVCKYASKGWGINAGEAIPKGCFVLHYSGELINHEEAARRSALYDRVGTTYLFALDPFHIRYNTVVVPFLRAHPDKEIPGASSAEYDELVDEAEQWWEKEKGSRAEDDEFSVDAGLWGNFARYFNHSCDPNMTVFSVYTTDRDLRRPFLSFFTNREVALGEELTFDYDFDTAENEVKTSIKMMKHVALNQESGTEKRYTVSRTAPSKESALKNKERIQQSGQSLHSRNLANNSMLPATFSSPPPLSEKEEAEKEEEEEILNNITTKQELLALRCQCGTSSCRKTVFRK